MVRESPATTYEEAKAGVPADFEEYERKRTLALEEDLPPEFGSDLDYEEFERLHHEADEYRNKQ